jgi:pyruvate-formate lyase
VERALYFTQSMQQTEGELLTLRWAKALKHIAENMTVYIKTTSFCSAAPV